MDEFIDHIARTKAPKVREVKSRPAQAAADEKDVPCTDGEKPVPMAP